ncbi:MAG: UDP-N-acetylglucosamine--N-acetylmuramyl-(pentapeptide) pyrophosphoryl-undecaprenol N-acetylglucosamine transferase [Myxococcota bacterium]|nr:UDP-N-acetylglucosamine--N-acetylmuramyl-(pentapeptide) pyrophosphoryl-undecaprenol N-acetylglucosamine transferase [Myxococcota bacterium]
MSSILLTGGGTGGHVYPALAVAQAVRASQPETKFAYAGVRGGIEENVAQKNDIPFLKIITAPYPGLRQPLRLIRFGFVIAVGTLMAIFHLMRMRPDVLVATGGYVSAPAVFAAVLLKTLRLSRVQVVVHEQNMRPGRFNSLVARFADVVGVSFPGSEVCLPGADARYVGYPVRPGLRLTSESASHALDGIPPHKRIVLAFGGSQGARTVNRAMVDALERLQHRDDIFIIHGVGRQQRSGYDPKTDVEQRIEALQTSGRITRDVSSFYRNLEYIDDIGSVYRAASLIICRGGAGTVKEVCAVGRPSIVLPKSGLAGDHQVVNALVLQDAGAAEVLLEEPTVHGHTLLASVSGVRLAERVAALLDSPEALEAMQDAAKRLDDPYAMQRILHAVDGVVPDVDLENMTTVQPESAEMALAAKPPGELLSTVRSWLRQHPKRSVERTPGYAYLCYRAASMTASPSWRIRNVGVKLIGLLKLVDRIPLLRHLYFDPTRASFTARLVGGDTAQNGFIRRNLVSSLIAIGVVDDDVVTVLQHALKDSYFEVRREAWRAVRLLGPELAQQSWVQNAVDEALTDSSFEVRISAIRAVPVVCAVESGVPKLRPFYLDRNWKIREGVMRAFELWLHADATAEQSALLRDEFDNILLTAGGYRPMFGLKETARRVARNLNSGASE